MREDIDNHGEGLAGFDHIGQEAGLGRVRDQAGRGMRLIVHIRTWQLSLCIGFAPNGRRRDKGQEATGWQSARHRLRLDIVTAEWNHFAEWHLATGMEFG